MQLRHGKNRAALLQKHDHMNSVAYGKNKKLSVNDVGHQYNFQHLVLVTKYRYKMFKNPKTIRIIRDALYDAAERHRMAIKEMSFGEDFAHIYGLQHTKYNVNFVCGTAVEGILVIQSIQRNASKQCDIPKSFSRLQSKATKMSI